MSNIRSLGDFNKGDKSNDNKTTNYTGGEHSGLSVENPENSPDKWPSSVSSSPVTPSNVVTIYKNGYILDGGPFHPLSEADHKRFVSDLKNGSEPKELRGANMNSGLIGVENRLEQVYHDTSESESKLFRGVGNSLSSNPSQSSLSGSFTSKIDLTQNPLQFDDTQPFTYINIRFHNGEKHKVRFNQSDTLADLHTFVVCVAPVEQNYRLVEGFPPQEVPSTDSVTLKDAGLIQTTVSQVFI